MTYKKLEGNWIKGTMAFDENQDIIFYAKVYEEGSRFGIGGDGKISKLEIRLGNEWLCNYDRGWDIHPTEEVKPLYEMILAEFN